MLDHGIPGTRSKSMDGLYPRLTTRRNMLWAARTFLVTDRITVFVNSCGFLRGLIFAKPSFDAPIIVEMIIATAINRINPVIIIVLDIGDCGLCISYFRFG